MKISSVTIEGFHNVTRKTYDFKHINYITGPNGAGKSTILDAIVYALFGYVPGTSKNSNEALFKHACADRMEVQLIIDNHIEDIVVTRSIAKNGSKYVSGFNINPDTYFIEDIIADLELPVFNFSEFIGMSSNKLKDWFIDFLPSTDFSTDWEKVLLENAGVTNILDPELLPATIDRIRSFNLTGLEELRKANEYIKSAISFKKGEAQRLQSTMQSLVFYDDFNPAEVSEEETRQELERYRNYLQDLNLHDEIVSRNREAESKLDASVSPEAIDKLRNEIDTTREEFQKVSAELLDVNSQIAKKEADIQTKTKLINGGGICPYTSSHCRDISKLVADYRNQVIEDTAAAVELRKKYAEKQSATNLLRNRIDTLEAQFRQAMKTVTEASSARANIVPVPDIAHCPPREAVVAKISELQNALVKIEANNKYQTMIDKLTAEKDAIEQTLAILKKWEVLTSINGLQASSGTDPFEAFATTIESYLPDIFENAKIHFISQGKNNTFSFGLLRGSTYVPFDLLSSGEKCIYTLALLIAVVKQSTSRLKLIVVDDLFDHLDVANMHKLFELLSSVEGVQMIFAGVPELSSEFENLQVIHISKE